MRTGGSIGIGTIVLALVAMYFGVDPSVVLQMAQGPSSASAPPAQSVPADDPQGRFVARVLGETEDAWRTVFAQQTKGSYQEPKLVLFRGAVPTACGTGQAAMGPFYCPGDSKVYLDLSFFTELQQRFKAPGDFAQAYVIAHEVGHHVQHLLGTFDRVDRLRGQAANARPMPCRCGWNSRPIATPASGPTMPTARARSSNKATSKKP